MTGTTISTRERILDAALDLTSRRGAAGTSMRELADACGVNVAALYYHFPSKADLLRAVIEERHYDLMLAVVEIPPAGTGTDRARLHQLLVAIWAGVQAEQPVWRMLLAESCHHNADAEEVARSLVARFEEAAAAWLGQDFDELVVPVTVAARLLSDFLFANIARAAIGATTNQSVDDDAAALAAVLVGHS
ncbi:MAG: TetR/AcrR family transcriptional regulator [Acidimicrobiia bacterium]|nr:TetR/AcrR family transcriptional regulator [Acidimicrobiia bacterium]